MDAPLRPDEQLAAEQTAERAAWRRRLLLWVLPLAVAALAVYFYGSAGRFVSTDNAYVQQDRVDVAPQVPGDVNRVLVGENTRVSAGQPVIGLDDTLLRIAAAGAESRLAATRTEVAALQAAYREKAGEVELARGTAEFAVRDFARQQQLADRKLVPASQLDTSHRSAELATAALAELDRARVDLEHTVIRAPQAGIVSHLPKVGNRLEMGRAAFAIVTDRRVWVEANFKETDLEWVRPGQNVRIDVDTYAQHRWTGRVESIAQATGAAFSLLPPQNAAGNWVKVVQRIPVRIALEPLAGDPPLRDGMSSTVEIDTGPHTRFDRWFGRGR
jgi:membrane fusion protein (multidrug efflux system)